jgi:phosphatidylethanolamine-binding protein (PEBP) family uncharacterized protein
VRIRLAVVLVLAVLPGCTGGSGHDLPPSGQGAHMDVSSPAFEPGAPIPVRFTCDGANEPPPIRWSGAPRAGTLVVVMSDADAKGFVHWLVYDVPGAASGEVGGGATAGIEGKNDFGRNGYDGPCPPKGDAPHRYVITVIVGPAGIPSPFAPGESPEEVIPDRVVAQGSLTGTYARR